MAIEVVIDGVTDAVTLEDATEFSISAPTTILADDIGVREAAVVYRLGPSGAYRPATNEKGPIVLSAYPNTAVLDAEGTYKITKTVTALEAYVGYGA